MWCHTLQQNGQLAGWPSSLLFSFSLSYSGLCGCKVTNLQLVDACLNSIVPPGVRLHTVFPLCRALGAMCHLNSAYHNSP